MSQTLKSRLICHHISRHIRCSTQNSCDSAAFSFCACSTQLLTPPPLRCVVTGSAITHRQVEGGGISHDQKVGAVAGGWGSGSGIQEGKQ